MGRKFARRFLEQGAVLVLCEKDNELDNILVKLFGDYLSHVRYTFASEREIVG